MKFPDSFSLLMVYSLSVGVDAAVFPPSRFPFEGIMATEDIPQFVTITFDDSVQAEKYGSIKKFLLDIQDSRGCPPRITHFTSFDWTQCEPVKFLYDSGAVEQAHHTAMHTGTPTVAQIKGAMDQLEGCGVPASEITGFRTPFLSYDETTLVNLAELGVIYDTTIIQDDDAASGYGVNNTWPFTLENGFTGSIKCGVTGSCINQSYPGMWEIPMYRWYDANNRLLNDIMDYPTFQTDVQQMFERRYYGNRAPFGIYLHQPWLNNNGAALKLWVEQTMATYSDVYFVTNMDLLEWMQNPVPKSEYVPKTCKTQEEMFGCLAPAPLYKCGGWGQFFNFETCQCECMQGFCPRDGGPSNGGVCTDWNCPTTPVAPTPTAPQSPSTPTAPVTSPVAPYNGPGCCSQTFKSCDVTWCGKTEAECNACTGELKWLADGPLTNCMGNWAWGCSADTDCCDGLVCKASSCTPGERSPTPVQSPTSPVTSPTAPITQPTLPTAPVTQPTLPTAPVTPPTSPVAQSIWDYSIDPMTDYKNKLGFPLQYPFERLFPVEEIPQFVVITIDDGVSDTRVKPTADYLMSIQTPDSRGCTPKITMFVSFDYTLCGLLNQLYRAKHEMATHTLSHEGYPSLRQIEGGFDGQAACGTPLEEVMGFRTPYLTYNQKVLEDLYLLQGKYGRTLYDSSIVVDGHGPTDYGRKNYWPWKWDHANEVIYKRSNPDANKAPHIEWHNFDPVKSSNMKGMWEIPMPLYYEPGTNTHYYQNMDYPFSHEIMWDNFNRRYNGNRAPFHINCHAPWLVDNGASLKLWIEELLGQNDDVFFVTNKQLLEYMENPVPLSEYRQQRICDAPEYDDSYCFPPNYSCSWWSQDWDSDTCSCVCKEGFCLRGGTCTDYNCPADSAPIETPVVTPVNPTPVQPPLAPVAPVTPPVQAPVYDGPGCCSNDFKTCISWCGTTEDSCNSCGLSDPKRWLADGALVNNNCAPRWSGYGCTSHDVCCPGLACLANTDGNSRSCLPGDRSVPVPGPPVAPPVEMPATAIAAWGQCGTTPSGGAFGVNCVSSYCAWGNEYWQSCQPCSRQPLNAFDCANYELSCGSTSAYSVCRDGRKLRGASVSS